MELQIIENFTQVSDWNKEVAMQNAIEAVGKYKGLVITPDTISDGKETRALVRKFLKESNDIGIKIERANTKDIKVMRKELKDVIDHINAEIVAPLDKQIKEIEEQEREEKRKSVNEAMTSIVAEYTLDEKHATMLTFDERYLNKSYDIKDIEIDLKNKAEVLRVTQDTIAANVKVITDTCEMHGIDPKSWVALLETRDVANIISMINESVVRETERKQAEERAKQEAELEAQRQKILKEQEAERQKMQAEFDAKEAELQAKTEEPTPEPAEHIRPIKLCKEAAESPIYTYELRMSGHGQQWKFIKDCMKKAGMEFEVLREVARKVNIEEVL